MKKFKVVLNSEQYMAVYVSCVRCFLEEPSKYLVNVLADILDLLDVSIDVAMADAKCCKEAAQGKAVKEEL